MAAVALAVAARGLGAKPPTRDEALRTHDPERATVYMYEAGSEGPLSER